MKSTNKSTECLRRSTVMISISILEQYFFFFFFFSQCQVPTWSTVSQSTSLNYVNHVFCFLDFAIEFWQNCNHLTPKKTPQKEHCPMWSGGRLNTITSHVVMSKIPHEGRNSQLFLFKTVTPLSHMHSK